MLGAGGSPKGRFPGSGRRQSGFRAGLEEEQKMRGTKQIDWSDLEAAAKEMAG